MTAAYLGGSAEETNFTSFISLPDAFQVVGTDVYIVGTTESSDFPVTNGSIKKASYDIFCTKLDALTGDILFSTYYGGNSSEDVVGVKVSAGKVHIVGETVSSDLPVTNGTIRKADNDLYYACFNTGTGALISSSYLAGGAFDSFQKGTFEVLGDHVYLTAWSVSTDYPITNPNSSPGGNIVVTKLDANTANILFSTAVGGTGFEWPLGIRVVGSNIHILGVSSSFNFPVTDGSSRTGGNDLVYVRLDGNNGDLLTSTILGGSGNDDTYSGRNASFQVVGNEVHIAGHTASSDFPVTNGSTKQAVFDGIYVKLNATTGALLFSTYWGGSGNDYFEHLQVDGDYVHLFGRTGSINIPGTNIGNSGDFDLLYTKLNHQTGALLTNAVICGASRENSFGLVVDGNAVHLLGYSFGDNYPVTNSSLSKGTDIAYTKLQLCPTGYQGLTAVSPATQTICSNGLVSSINMGHDSIPPTAQPTLYLKGVASLQKPIYALYQWQEATNISGPFTNIAGATDKSFTPPTGVVTKYYRRVSYYMCNGVQNFIRYGDTASVIISSNAAPTVDAGTNRFVCPGTTLTLGGSPTATPATGGAGIATYLWSPAVTYTPNNAVPNPTVTPAASTIYTVLVTDSNGCQQQGQISITIEPTPAGPDLGSCQGQPVRIGKTPLSFNGVTYNWTSSPAGFTSTEAQPTVTPAVTTTYTLTLTIPLQGGGTCSYSDAMVVTPVLAPQNNGGNFTGNDTTICRGTSFQIGATGADAGFTYTWAPGNYINSTTNQRPTFNAGNFLPSPNPFTYYLTATKSGCVFIDSIKVTVLSGDAGKDVACPPRPIGLADETPNINDTYSWSVISGTGSFLSATNQPQVVVGATDAVYRRSVSFNGRTCTDDVVVSTAGCKICPKIEVGANIGCPSFDLNGGPYTLFGDLEGFAYIWSTTGGITLSNSKGRTVTVTNNNNGTVSFTAVNLYDTSIVCTATIDINNPFWALPAYTAKDTSACPGVAVQIGAPTTAGYTYAWANTATLTNRLIADPLATAFATTNYAVVVTDTGSGCLLRDTSTVTIPPIPPNAAGNNFTICGAATGVQLGIDSVPGISYSWTSNPAGAVFNPGANVANPTVDVSATTAFYVTATSGICSITDTITVTVASPIPAFSFTDSTFCPSDTGAILLPSGPTGAGYSYSWISSIDVINPNSNTTATTTNPRPQIPTTYTLLVTNANGCTGSASITLTPTITLPDAGIDRVLCSNGGSVEIGSTDTARNPVAATYLWTTTTLGTLSSTTVRNPTFTPSAGANGRATLRLTKTVGTCSTIDEVQITVNTYTLPALTSPTICQGTSVQIGTTPVFGNTYTWSPATGLSNANIANPIASPTTTTTYTLTSVSPNGCRDTKSVVVTVRADTSSTISIPNVEGCIGTSATLNPTITPSGSYTYVWTPNNGRLSNVNIANPTVVIPNTIPQTYTLAVTNTTTGCTNTQNVVVTGKIKTIVSGGGNAIACVTVPITNIVFTSSGATGIGTPTGLPTGVTASFANNTITVSGIPISTGMFNYSIPVLGGCDTTFATGMIEVLSCTLLPVELVSFQAMVDNCNVNLTWKTASEINNQQFEVYRSEDAINWQEIGVVAGNGTTNTPKQYSFTDNNAPGKLVYYRLKQIDFDGVSEWLPIVSLDLSGCQSRSPLRMYPNPASSIVRVEVPYAGSERRLLTIYNTSGAIVDQQDITGEVLKEVSVQSLTSGLYIFSVADAFGVVNEKIEVFK